MNILIIQGHPDRDRKRFGYRLSDAYKESAEESGFAVREIFLADIDFPLLRSHSEFYTQVAPPVIPAAH